MAAHGPNEHWYLALEHLLHLLARANGLLSQIDRTLNWLDAASRWIHAPHFVEDIKNRIKAIQATTTLRRDLCNELLAQSNTNQINDEQYVLQIQSLRNWFPIAEHHFSYIHQIVSQRMDYPDNIDGARISPGHEEFGNPQLLFRAADVTIESFTKAVFGNHTYRKEDDPDHVRPIALFSSSRGYAYATRYHVAMLPDHDFSRPWMWAALAHEIAHGRIQQISGSASKVRHGKSFQYGDRLHVLMQKWHERIGSEYNTALDQSQELLADAVAACVAGPASLFSLLAIHLSDRVGSLSSGSKKTRTAAALEWAAGDEHPPLYLRTKIIASMLDQSRTFAPCVRTSLLSYWNYPENLSDEQETLLEAWQGYSKEAAKICWAFCQEAIQGSFFGEADLALSIDLSSIEGRVLAPARAPREISCAILLNVEWMRRHAIACDFISTVLPPDQHADRAMGILAGALPSRGLELAKAIRNRSM